MPLRPFEPEDYPQLAALQLAIWPEYPSSESELRHWDEHRDPKCRFERWVWDEDGRIIANCGFHQRPDAYHPQRFGLSCEVHPEFRRRGLGGTMYRHVRERLAPHRPIRIGADAREDHEEALGFLQRRGFRELMREWESRLEVGTFDPAPFAGAEDRVRENGISIRSLRELEADPERDRKLHALIYELDRDVPSPDEPTPVDFDLWRERFRNKPGLLSDAYFVAVDGDEYVGVSWVNRMQAADYLDTGLTGVKRSHRRKGIALALKLRIIEFARREGYPEIRTWNEVNNQGMLGINIRLGFQRQPAWVMLGLELEG